MRSFILLFVGIILIGTGILTFYMLNKNLSNVPTESIPFDFNNLQSMITYGVSGLIGGIGGLFTLIGLIGVFRNLSKSKEAKQILKDGIDAEATVTFVDKNYSILVNQRPIYSIVEYTYQDSFGNNYTNRINNLNSEQVIRKQIQVGTTIPIKYSNMNPAKSTIVM